MNSASRVLFLALLLPGAGWTDAASVASYEDALKAVCNHLIAKSNEGRPAEPCGDGSITDGCRENIKEALYEECEPDYGNESECGCSGRRIGPAAATRIAPGSSYQQDDVTDDLCLARDLWHDVYQEEIEKNPGIMTMYIGFLSGAFHMYPASNWKQKADPDTGCRIKLEAGEDCPPYDPRTRKWFYTAAVGPKNVVLLLDTSGSMWFKDSRIKDSVSRIDLLKSAAHAVIDSLTSVDYLGIITFSDSTQFWNDSLQPANEANRNLAKTWISARAQKGGTDFGKAFKATSELVGKSLAEGSATRCKTAILFLTDGHPGESDSSPWEGIEYLEGNETNMFVFSYTLGQDADQEVPRDIACRTRGVHQHVEDNGDLSAAMTTYWRVLAGGRGGRQTDNKVLWGDPYVDFLGLGEVLSPGLKCQIGERPVAVAALDIVSQRDPEIFESFAAHVPTECPNFHISDDELAKIRDHPCGSAWAPRHPFMGVAVVLLASYVTATCERAG